jgi:hypothetical protein
VTPEIIAEFAESDLALRVAQMLGPDYTVCDGTRSNWWGVRPKSRRECGFSGTEPSDSYIDEDRDDE